MFEVKGSVSNVAWLFKVLQFFAVLRAGGFFLPHLLFFLFCSSSIKLRAPTARFEHRTPIVFLRLFCLSA